MDRTLCQSSAFSVFSMFWPSAFPNFPGFRVQTFTCVTGTIRIFCIFCVFAWSGPNCKMRKIRPTGLTLTGLRCSGRKSGKKRPKSNGQSGSEMGTLFSVMVCFGPGGLLARQRLARMTDMETQTVSVLLRQYPSWTDSWQGSTSSTELWQGSRATSCWTTSS